MKLSAGAVAEDDMVWVLGLEGVDLVLQVRELLFFGHRPVGAGRSCWNIGPKPAVFPHRRAACPYAQTGTILAHLNLKTCGFEDTKDFRYSVTFFLRDIFRCPRYVIPGSHHSDK